MLRLKATFVFFLLGDSSASEFYVPTFRNNLFHLDRSCSQDLIFTRPMKMEQTECSEMSAHTIQTPGHHPKERIQHSQHSESLKSSKSNLLAFYFRVLYGYFQRRYNVQWTDTNGERGVLAI
jgi:hypothetical protein